MEYRSNKNGEQISILGYGCMRFTTKAGSIDIDKAEQEIMTAYNSGVNYYDTAYVYPGSEAALGEILERNSIREKVNIATKLPQYLVSSAAALDKYFNEELKRLRTDYIDYYLMHHMTAMNQWDKLEKLGVKEWIAQKKASGQIRNIGFSYHGNTEDFIGILDAYDWDFCQIQYNYMDEHSQAGLKGLKHAASKGIPVVIMEPLRGGKLVNLLPDKAKEKIAQYEKGYTPAELGLRWLWNQLEVTCVLSGMNSVEMVQENCRIAADAKADSFTREDFELVDQVKSIISESELVGCTGCRYCMPCPKGVDIPALFRCYNMTALESKSAARFEYAQTVGLKDEPAFATQCIECGKCEQHCPQSIPIREMIKKADKAVRPLPYKIGINIARRIMLK
ncbi:aldo/keto reductase [Pseudobutyrivibrio sp.]|uniref:aldo/keto reductase n=1 Tax=Pseudobutyrivibrio sp. TaxID=2014367 RepID=UPI001B6E85F0|nr:aldo/keto reductase [Pseudobutyrivibrio sp.]MBP3261251.1 aldo/keto reductase [Pseudobutyrivibrio sp.]